MNIYKADDLFDFNSITLANPQPVQGGSFFTKLSVGLDKPLYMQLSKCVTKQNIVEAMRGKYCDLMYERNDEAPLMNWIEKFEHSCQDKIDVKKSLWFQTELSRDDIETMMSPMARLYKSGKNILIRAYLNTAKHTGKDKYLAYDENEQPVDLDTITADKYIIPLILIDGIKFSSRSFEIEIKLVQIMVIEPPLIKEVVPVCLIKNFKPNHSNSNSNTNVDINTTKIVEEKEKPLAEKPLEAHVEAKPLAAHVEAKPLAAHVEAKPLEAHVEAKPLAGHVETEESVSISTIEPSLEKPKQLSIDGVEEVCLNFNDIKESITLKKPNDVYYEIYKAAREKAKQMRKVAMEAYLEAKEIKTKYMLSDIDDSDESEYEEEES